MSIRHYVKQLSILLVLVLACFAPVSPVLAQEKYSHLMNYVNVETIPQGKIVLGSKGQIRPLPDSLVKDFQHAFTYHLSKEGVLTIDERGNWVAVGEGTVNLKVVPQGPSFTAAFLEEADRYGVKVPNIFIEIAAIWPSYTIEVLPQSSPVYRLYHEGLKAHLYTTDQQENTILATRGWRQEGVSWKTGNAGGEPVYRLYHPDLKTHHYTKDQNEYTVLATRGWQQEGEAYRSAGEKAVYRLYHEGLKKHLYTPDENEYKILATRGWKQEGVAWYSQP